jgi:hypothetical protein
MKGRMGRRVGRWAGLAALLSAALSVLGVPVVAEASTAAPKAEKRAAKNAKGGPKKGRRTIVARRTQAPPPRSPMDGNTYDYAYDASDVGRPEQAWAGRVFVHGKAAGKPEQTLPLLVFLHGLNIERIDYRWMGGGQEGDVRRIVSDLIEGGTVPPMLIAAPTSVNQVAVGNAATCWPAFDLDTFLDRTTAELAGKAKVDRTRIIVAGHSGAGCNVKGGVVTALKAKAPVLAGLVIDSCMGLDLAKELPHLRPTLHVVVSWQTSSWQNRPFHAFRDVFLREVKKLPPSEGVLRELSHEQLPMPMPHDAMVEQTLKKWLPRLLSPPAPAPKPPRDKQG